MKIVGVLIIVLSLLALKGMLDLYRIQTEGEIVGMTVLAMPKDCSIRSSSIQVQYGRKRFFKKAMESICNRYKIGDTIPMKYIAGADNALYPDESIVGELVSLALFIMVGILFFILGMKKRHRIKAT